MPSNSRFLSGQCSVAIIGAGLAGLTCAVALKGLVSQVKIFEKNAFPGGRMGYFHMGEYEFNHGPQYFTVSHPLFWNIVSAWQSAGFVKPWDGWLVELQKGQINHVDGASERFVGQPNMQAIIQNLSLNCDLEVATRISEIEQQKDGWRLFNDDGDYLGAFDIVIIATTAHQVSSLCADITDISEAADNIDMAICWSSMFVFDSKLDLPFDAAHVLDSPLSWMSRHQSPDGADCWVLHATPEWSQQYAASFEDRVTQHLLDAFWQATDLPEIEPIASSVHCWKHAVPINTIKQDSLFVESKLIGACGDWCAAPRVEGAVLSGFSMADRIMRFMHQSKV